MTPEAALVERCARALFVSQRDWDWLVTGDSADRYRQMALAVIRELAECDVPPETRAMLRALVEAAGRG
jgi:hypothetical protein